LTALAPEALAGNRLAALGALELIADCGPDVANAGLENDLLQVVFEDFSLVGAAGREWATYAARACIALGHEVALQNLSDREKADLRSFWKTNFPRIIAKDSRSTFDHVTDLRRTWRTMKAGLADQSRSARAAVQRLVANAKDLSNFLDDAETRLLKAACKTAAEASALPESSTISTVLAENMENCREQAQEIAESSSVALQEIVAPILNAVEQDLEDLRVQLADSSRPDLTISLVTDRLPIRDETSPIVELRVRVINRGNVDAIDLDLTVEGERLLFPEQWRLDSLAPGGQAEAVLDGLADNAGRVEPVIITLSCVDALRQSFSISSEFNIEDERPSSWHADDANPFTLKVVTDPIYLIGRDSDLATLQATLASGSSVSVTGQKRVGKSSIVQSMLTAASAGRGWATEYLPLGRAVRSEGVAADLVFALLLKISRAVSQKYPELSQPTLEPNSVREWFPVRSGEWLSDLGDRLPIGCRVIVAIDDFDELPPQLREGEDADSLFLFLRSMIDEPWLGLLFVGSEVLPTIIASHAHKLNQVVPLRVDGFKSRTQTRELLEQLGSDRIEWDHAAVDRIHQLTDGVPYYSRQIAFEVWNALKQRNRTYAHRADVEDAVKHLAQNAPISHYTHLWADDPKGMSLRERRSVMASAILRAVAQCSGEELAAARVDEVVQVAQGWMRAATLQELKETIQRLLSREVLVGGASAETVELPLGLVTKWLLGVGGRAIEQYYSDTYLAGERATVISDRELVDLSNGLSYCGERITETRLRAWLEQFENGDHRRWAFLLMRRLISEGFFAPEQFPDLANSLRKAVLAGEAGRYQRLDKFRRLTNFYLIEHGLGASSSNAALNFYAKQFKIRKSNVVSPDEFASLLSRLSGTETLVALVLDEFAGSGQQIRNAADGLAETLDAKAGALWREQTVLVVGCALSARKLTWSADKVASYAVEGQILPRRLRAFDTGAEIFDGAEERERARDLMHTIGRSLVKNQPLGFGDAGLLVSTYTNCPNNSLPIFWSHGRYAGRPWLPLFERHT
jgi:hypothetical protein